MKNAGFCYFRLLGIMSLGLPLVGLPVHRGGLRTRPQRWRVATACRVALPAGLLWSGAIVSQATPYYVATNALHQTPFDTWAKAASNIQDAISVAINADDIVWVSNGVYETGGVTNWPSGTTLTNRVAITNTITVRSANNNPTNTIIRGTWNSATTNGLDAVRCVYMVNGSSLIGFMLTNGATLQINQPSSGTNHNHRGGGVWSESTSTVISNCVITVNSADNSGGGAYGGTLYNCTLSGNNTTTTAGDSGNGGGACAGTLYNCILTNNFTVSKWGSGGGAAYCGLMYNCTIVNNSTRGNSSLGGGVYQCTVYNCNVSGNQAQTQGGGADNCSAMYNCTIVGNSASEGGGVCGTVAAPCTMYNCIVYFNTATTGSNWSGTVSFTNCCTTTGQIGWASSGNITDDPMLIDKGGGYGLSHVAGNYRLSANSPCVNTGTNQSWMTTTYPYDLDGRARIRYGTVDMGAYERINEGTIYGFH